MELASHILGIFDPNRVGNRSVRFWPSITLGVIWVVPGVDTEERAHDYVDHKIEEDKRAPGFLEHRDRRLVSLLIVKRLPVSIIIDLYFVLNSHRLVCFLFWHVAEKIVWVS